MRPRATGRSPPGWDPLDAEVQAQTEALGQGWTQGQGWVEMGMGTGMGIEAGLPQAGLTIPAQHQHPAAAGTPEQVSLGKGQFLPCPGVCN